jgi:hypothetical protein
MQLNEKLNGFIWRRIKSICRFCPLMVKLCKSFWGVYKDIVTTIVWIGKENIDLPDSISLTSIYHTETADKIELEKWNESETGG